MASYIAAALNAGTYIIRVAYSGSASGAYTLMVYDNGACVQPCNPATSVTVYLSPTAGHTWLNFSAPDTGDYVVYSTIVKNNDGDPRDGDPQWTLEGTVHVSTAGNYNWTDPGALAGYKNYAVVHDCGSPIGRCCYGPLNNPSCADNSEAQCTTLGGEWNQYRSCTAHPCLVINPDGAENCATVGELGGPLPISITDTTTGHTDDFNMTTWTQPTCWQQDTWTVNDASGEDVCWGWIVPATGTYTFSTCAAASYDNSILLFNFTCPTAPTQGDFICGNDDAGTTTCSAHSTAAVILNVSLTQGQHILIDCDGYSTNDGTFTLVISQP